MSFFKKRKRALSFSPPPTKINAVTQFEVEGKSIMANPSEFEIPSAILAASVVAKSDLKGDELQSYAINLQIHYVNRMVKAREEKEASKS